MYIMKWKEQKNPILKKYTLQVRVEIEWFDWMLSSAPSVHT